MVCTHPKRALIEAEIVKGTPYRRVASRYGLSEASVRRHCAHHLPSGLAQAVHAEELTRVDWLLGELERLRAEAAAIAEEAKAKRAYGAALAAIREQTRILELLLKVAGELKESPTVHITTSWVELRTLILTALEAYPEARERLVEVLRHGTACRPS